MDLSPRPESTDWELQWKIAKSETIEWNTRSLILERQVRKLNHASKCTKQLLEKIGLESIEQLEEYVQAVKIHILNLEADIESKEKTRATERATLNEFQQQSQQLIQKLEQEKDLSTRLKDEIGSIAEFRDKLEQSMHDQAQGFKAELQDMSLRLERSHHENIQNTERLKAFENAMTQQASEYQALLEKSAKETEMLRATIESIDQEKHQLLQSESNFKSELNNLKSVYGDLESESRYSKEEISDLNDALSTLQERNAELETYVKSLEEKIDQGQVIFSQLAQTELAIKVVESQLSDLKAQEVATQQELEYVQEEKESLRHNMELLNTDNSRLYAEIKQMGCNNTEMNAYILNLENSNTNLKKEIEENGIQYRRQLQQIENECCTKSEAAEKIEELHALLVTEQERNSLNKQQMEETEGLVNEKMSIICQLRNEISLQKSVINDQKLRIETHENAKMIERDHIRQNEELRRQVYAAQVAQEEAYGRLQMESKLRRQLQERLLEMKGTIRVFCRVRPLLGHEMFREGSLVFDSPAGTVSVSQTTNGYNSVNPKITNFKFDQVFDASSTNADIFQEVDLLIQSIFNGFSCCIFAYGQTGSGKSYTMLSPSGIVHSTIENIFELMKITDHSTDYTVYASFFEIYNEQVIDITSNSKASSPSHGILKGVQEHIVEDTQGLVEILEVGLRNRAVGATKMNQGSSRSHTIYTIRIKGVNKASGDVTNGKLNLIDLAGSERLDKSQVKGPQLKETQAINKSLSALGDVIHALASNPKSHIPFRNSKLTHMLQDSLTGKSKTLMLVNVSPALSSLQETLTSLRFAEKVNSTKLRE